MASTDWITQTHTLTLAHIMSHTDTHMHTCTPCGYTHTLAHTNVHTHTRTKHTRT